MVKEYSSPSTGVDRVCREMACPSPSDQVTLDTADGYEERVENALEDRDEAGTEDFPSYSTEIRDFYTEASY